MTPGLEDRVVDVDAHRRNLAHLRRLRLQLPGIADLADPPGRLAARAGEIAGVDPDLADVRNLFRVHWHNGADRRSLVDVPEHMVLPESLTGVKARIVVAFGNKFPLIGAHKVLAAYGCLIPRLLSGAFDVNASPRGLALHGQLLPRWGGDRQAPGMPVRRGAAGRDEPGAFRLARALGDGRERHSPHSGHGEQRQGDLRCLSRPGEGRGEPDPQPVLGVRELHRAPRRHRAGAGADIPVMRPGWKRDGAGLRLRFRFGGDARGRRLSQGLPRHAYLRRRGAGMPDLALQRIRRAQHPGHR